MKTTDYLRITKKGVEEMEKYLKKYEIDKHLTNPELYFLKELLGMFAEQANSKELEQKTKFFEDLLESQGGLSFPMKGKIDRNIGFNKLVEYVKQI